MKNGPIEKLFERLRREGVELSLEGDVLKFRTHGAALSPSTRELLRTHRPEVMAHLRAGRAVTHIGPLTPGQAALWFLWKLAPEAAAYNIALAFRLRGWTDDDLLRRACQRLAARHPALRTVLPARVEDGMPEQRVLGYRAIAWEVVEAGRLDREALTGQVLAASQRPFDLEHGPLWRVVLFRTGHAERVLLLTFHHVITDGASTWLLLRELEELLRSLPAGREPDLPEPGASFADFASWQAEWLGGPEGSRCASYWRGQLGGYHGFLELPADHPRPPAQTFRGASHYFGLGEDLGRQVRDLAAAERVTPTMVLLASTFAWLKAVTGQDDLAVSLPTAGRPGPRFEPRFENVVGYFVNPIVLRVRAEGDPTFRELLGQVRSHLLDGMDHASLPFVRVVESLGLRRDPAIPPLAQVSFVFQTPRLAGPVAEFLVTGPDDAERPWGGARISPFRLPQEEGQLDLSLEVVDTPGYEAVLKYHRDLFQPETAARFVTGLKRVLEAAVGDPGRPVSTLLPATLHRNVVPDRAAGPPGADELERILNDFNDTGPAFPDGITVLDLLVEQARRAPGAVAVIDPDGVSLSYGQLLGRSGALGRQLREAGVGPGSIVGLATGRTLEFLVGLWGILRTGAAFLPLDPDLPDARLRFMVEDAQCAMLLVRTQDADRWRFGPPTMVIDGRLDEGDLPPPRIAPDDPAYVMYTSGTTGSPKGVVISHDALAGFTLTLCERLGLTADDGVLQFSNLGFDLLISEVFSIASAGGRLVLRSDACASSPDLLLETCNTHDVTLLILPTAFWSELVSAMEDGWRYLPSRVRLLLFAGEACRHGDVERCRQLVGPRVPLLNAYGPTEATVYAAIWEAPSEGPLPDPIPIGRPVRGGRLYILDEARRPVPIGAEGVLYVGGRHVGLGYLGRPDLTRERFVPDPFLPGGRMYDTGDRARWRPDGTIEYLGRVDEQIKIRGFRVEPAEVEAAVVSHPAVAGARVRALPGPGGRHVLVAWVVARQGQEIVPGELATFLGSRLPSWMLPSDFVVLSAFPLTPSGKVDIARLPPPEAASPSVNRPPSSATEKLVASTWCEVLGIPAVDVHDNFFDLGGSSLLLIQVNSRLERALQRKIPVVDLFRHSTVHSVARYLDSEVNDDSSLARDEARVEKQRDLRAAAIARRRGPSNR